MKPASALAEIYAGCVRVTIHLASKSFSRTVSLVLAFVLFHSSDDTCLGPHVIDLCAFYAALQDQSRVLSTRECATTRMNLTSKSLGLVSVSRCKSYVFRRIALSVLSVSSVTRNISHRIGIDVLFQ